MSLNHAPGLWSLEDITEGGPFKLSDADGEFVTYLSKSRYVDDRDDPIAEANALLIAAAPELLEALRKALAAIDRKGGPQMGVTGKDYKIVDTLRAAIAKATS